MPPAAAPPDLAEARALAAAREWRTLAERLAPLADEALLHEPERALLLADALWRVGEAPRAAALAHAAEPAVRRGGHRRMVLDAINIAGIAAFQTGRIDHAETCFEALLEQASAWSDDEFAARAANNLGVIANVRGRRELALTFYERALAAYHRLGQTRGLAETHHNLGISYRDLGFDGEADAHWRRAIELGRTAGSEEVIALAESDRAMLRARAGDGALAERLAARARERFEHLGDPTGAAEALRVMAAASRARGDDALARERLEAVLATARAHEDLLLRAEVQRDLGMLLQDAGNRDAARLALLDAAAAFEAVGAAEDMAAMREAAALVDGAAS